MAEPGLKTTENVKAIEGFQPIEDTPVMNAGNPNLYDMATQLIMLGFELNELYNVEEPDDELIEQKEAAMDEIVLAAGAKFDDAVFVLNDMQSRIDTLAGFIANLQKKKKSVANGMERLKGYLKFIGLANPQAIKGEAFKGSVYTKPSVDDDYDVSKVPDQYFKETTTQRLIKKMVLDAFKVGEEVPGTHVTVKEHLRII